MSWASTAPSFTQRSRQAGPQNNSRCSAEVFLRSFGKGSTGWGFSWRSTDWSKQRTFRGWRKQILSDFLDSKTSSHSGKRLHRAFQNLTHSRNRLILTKQSRVPPDPRFYSDRGSEYLKLHHFVFWYILFDSPETNMSHKEGGRWHPWLDLTCMRQTSRDLFA